MKNQLRNAGFKAAGCRCTRPSVFTIPLDIYKDELEKDRDKEAFLKLQKLRKNCEQLRQKLQIYLKEHIARLEKPNSLVFKKMDFRNGPDGSRTNGIY
jgi:hypothetical protein